MNTLKKYNLSGQQTGEVAVAEPFLRASANSQMIKDYITAIRANARQWSASTKGRSEVSHTTKKPHPQKKTGRARHGDLVGAQFRGGGVVLKRCCKSSESAPEESGTVADEPLFNS